MNRKKHIHQQNHIITEIKTELFGELEFFDACTIAFYTSMLSILASVGLYAFVFYCI